ncbi:hypothetical protein BGZ72_003756 [Mortierella alpina]|nr:hypothetical protein BGZ72_003756 [Mortierella alpina]
MENSAQQLYTFTEKVMEATGAKKVDLLGYSAGTMVAEYYTKRLNGASNVENIAGIAPIHYGTTLKDITTFKKYVGAFDFEAEMLRQVCESCLQVVTNSKFINDLYAGGDALLGIQYLMVATKTDTFVTPYKNGFLRSTESNVHNQLLQDWCPNDMTGHPLLQLNRNVFNGINAFLTSSARTAECLDSPLMTQ